jgi:hypothetical protein
MWIESLIFINESLKNFGFIKAIKEKTFKMYLFSLKLESLSGL